MKSIKTTFLKGFQNAAYMSLGSFAAQAIGFIGFLFIARLFGPENYGKYATVLAFVMFFHLFVFNGLSKIIVREGSKAKNQFSIVLEKTIGLRLVLAFAAFVICIFASFFTRYPAEIKLFIILFSSEIIYFGLNSYLGTIYQTKERMEYIAYFSVLTRFLTAGLSIAFLYLGAGILAILIINLFSKFVVLYINYLYSQKFTRFRWNLKLNLDPLILKALLIFSLMGFINTFAVRIDVLMVSFLSTSKDVGLYSVAHELGREGLMLRNIIATAFFPIAVKFFDREKAKANTLLKYGIGSGLIVLLGCLIIHIFSEKLVVLLFREQFRASGIILKYLVFYLPFTFFSLPFATCLQATHNESVLLFVYTITALANIPLNIVLFYRFGLVGIAYSTIIVFFIEAVLVTLLSYKKMRRQGYLV